MLLPITIPSWGGRRDGESQTRRSHLPPTPALSICFHLLINARRAADMSHRRGWAQERGFPAREAHHPLERAAGQELTPFHGADGKHRNKIQLTQKKKPQELGYGNDGAQLSGQTGGSACSLLAKGSKDLKVFSRPKRCLFIFIDHLLRRTLFLQGKSPISVQGNLGARAAEGSADQFPLYPPSAWR